MLVVSIVMVRRELCEFHLRVRQRAARLSEGILLSLGIVQNKAFISTG